MKEYWKFGTKSDLLISIVGSASSYVKDERFERLFKENLTRVRCVEYTILHNNIVGIYRTELRKIFWIYRYQLQTKIKLTLLFGLHQISDSNIMLL